MDLGWPVDPVLDGVQIPMQRGNFEGKRPPIVKYRDSLPWTVQKRLNWSICRLVCGLGYYYYRWGGAHWHNLPNTIEPSICGGDAAFPQITLTICYYQEPEWVSSYSTVLATRLAGKNVFEMTCFVWSGTSNLNKVYKAQACTFSAYSVRR